VVIFLDTSAAYALADPGDLAHRRAREGFERIEREREELVLHTYVLVEIFALLHRRRGLEAALRTSDRLREVRTVVVDRAIHDEGAAWLERRRDAGTSLVDAVSFVVMRRERIRKAFAFDEDFVCAGFELYGGGGAVGEGSPPVRNASRRRRRSSPPSTRP